MRLLFLLLLVLPTASPADPVLDRVIDDVALPGVAAFAEATEALAEAAEADCTPTAPGLRAAWNGAMDAWFGVQDLRFGPLDDGTRLAIAFWPDTRGLRPKALDAVLSGALPLLETPALFAEAPISVRGLYAVEALLYDPRFNGYGVGDPGCVLVRLASADLARVAAGLRDDWVGDFASVMRTAGAEGNALYASQGEARQAVFTGLLMVMQHDVKERLGRPIGTPGRVYPDRAEAVLSGRSQRNLELSLAAHQRLARALVPEPEASLLTREDFERVDWMLSELDDPVFAGVSRPDARIRLEALQATLTILRADLYGEFTEALGVTMGLNALDGD
ncbi:MAG: imelysin family protein [Maritimibacter sp.]|nr:imelysin family protein [Maritimibacter sp.]